jgi:hypothetical protein
MHLPVYRVRSRKPPDMDKPAIVAKAHRVVIAASHWVSYLGTVAVLFLIAWPLLQVVADYWMPRAQAVLQTQAPVKAEPKKGKL